MGVDLHNFLNLFSKKETIFWAILIIASFLLGYSFITLGILIYIIHRLDSKAFRITSYIIIGLNIVIEFTFNVGFRFFVNYVFDNDLFLFLGETIGERYQWLNAISYAIPFMIHALGYIIILLYFTQKNDKNEYKYFYYYVLFTIIVYIVNVFTLSARIWFQASIFPNVGFLSSIGYVFLIIQYLRIKFNLTLDYETYGNTSVNVEEIDSSKLTEHY